MFKNIMKTAMSDEGFIICSVILFTNKHALVAKVLEDPIYSQALHEISGEKVAVMHAKMAQGRHELPRATQGCYSRMVPIWKEPNENLKLLQFFEIKSSEDLPCVTAFLIHDGEFIVGTCKISAKSQDETFSCLSDILSTLAKIAESTSDRVEAIRKAKFRLSIAQKKMTLQSFIKMLAEVRGATGL
jgi:hypothetical protein